VGQVANLRRIANPPAGIDCQSARPHGSFLPHSTNRYHIYILNKQDLSERDICTKYITPAVKQAGGDEMTRIIVRGKLVTRGKAKRADYVLILQTQYPHRPDRSQRQQPQRRPRNFVLSDKIVGLQIAESCYAGTEPPA